MFIVLFYYSDTTVDSSFPGSRMWTTNGRKLRYGIKEIKDNMSERLIEMDNLPNKIPNNVLKKAYCTPHAVL